MVGMVDAVVVPDETVTVEVVRYWLQYAVTWAVALHVIDEQMS